MAGKKNKNPFSEKLQSKNAAVVIETIREIRRKGIRRYLNDIIDLLNTTASPEIAAEITRLLNDLKDQNAIPYIIDAIKDKKNEKIRQILISSCWQSGLDYTEYFNVFIDLAVESDYLVTLEIFTVVENSVPNLSREAKIYHADILRSQIESCSFEKRKLIEEMILMLDDEF